MAGPTKPHRSLIEFTYPALPEPAEVVSAQELHRYLADLEREHRRFVARLNEVLVDLAAQQQP